MKLEDLTIVSQLAEFLSGTQAVTFSIISDKDDHYSWIQGVLVKFSYHRLGKQDKGVVIHYLMKISGNSRQQITRLIAQYRKTGKLTRQQHTVAGFIRKYTANCWRRWTSAMTHPATLRARSCVSAPMKSLGRWNMPRWHRSR